MYSQGTSHLKVLLAVEHDGLGLDFPVLDVHLVAGQHDGDVLAHPAPRKLKEDGLTITHHTTASTIPDQVSVPVRHVLVGHSGGHVKHNDRTLALKMDMWLMVDGSTKLVNMFFCFCAISLAHTTRGREI